MDKELSPLVQRELSTVPQDGVEETLLRADYRATTNRMLRVSTNGFMESLKLVLEVIETLDGDVLEGKLQSSWTEKPSIQTPAG